MTVGKAVALRRAGSLPALVALEVGAVVGLHRLGGLAAFRVPWQHFGRDLGAWLLYSPVEDVLGAVLRMVALLVAWWLLLSTALYLAASVTRVPALVRSVEWLALPVVRRVADRAVAVALATSIAGASPAAAGTMARCRCRHRRRRCRCRHRRRRRHRCRRHRCRCRHHHDCGAL